MRRTNGSRWFARSRLGGVITAALVGIAAAVGEASDGGPVDPAGYPFGRCMGDCNGDEQVTIGELLLGVRIALDRSPPSLCEAGGPGSIGIAGVTSAVRNALLGCVTERDLSVFSEFEWQQGSALGFCPEVGSLASVRLSHIGDDYCLATSVFVLRDPLPPECSSFPRDYCVTAEPQSCRMLTLEEVAEVRDAFSRVQVRGPDAACLVYIFDPCLVKSARWDDRYFSDFPCSSDRLVEEEADRLEAFLESLGSEPEIGARIIPCCWDSSNPVQQ